MPSLRDIRRHVESVESINKVTKAMEVVSLARSRRLIALANGSQPYADMSWRMLQHLLTAGQPSAELLPFLGGKERPHQLALVVIAGDSGMVGGYNHYILRLVDDYVEQRTQADESLRAEIVAIGRMARQHFSSPSRPPSMHLYADYPLPPEHQGIAAWTLVARSVLDGFQSERFDQVAVAYTSSTPKAYLAPQIRTLLPLADMARDMPVARATPDDSEQTPPPAEYIHEPEPAQLLRSLLPRVIRFQLYQAYLQSLVAENTSRAIAMRAATHNGQELIDRLAISYNRARQAGITSELIDILSGVGSSEHG